MIDQDFLKTLTILYVEDDDNARNSFAEILNKLFKKVIVVEDGLDALNIFKESKKSNDMIIDTIISDIDLPSLNGLDLLDEIRKYDESVPFLYTTGDYKSEELIRAIKLGVTEFFVKPLNVKEIITYIQKVCEKRYESSRIVHYQAEVKKYVEVIDQVAIVARMDENANYKYVNEFFCEVSGYQADELEGKTMLTLKPDDLADSLYKVMWDELHEGKVWRGKLRLKAKNGEDFYVTSTIFPILDEENKKSLEYISIEFITTEYEHQKRKFKKEVMYNLKETRRINTVARQKIDDLIRENHLLEEKLKSYQHFDVLENKLKMEKKRNAALNSQIKYYEDQVKDSRDRYEKVSTGITDRITKSQASTNSLKKKTAAALQEVAFLKSQIVTMEKDRESLNHLVEKRGKIIADLQGI
ncbi:MAG: response regulator [Campylobacteraceae bacterium]|nr:response regulator [Campylobacteraceae bacterium]